MENTLQITLTGSEYDRLSAAKWPYERTNFWQNILRERNVTHDEIMSVSGQEGSLIFDVKVNAYENYWECFEKNIKGQKALGISWVPSTSENNYRGGMAIQFENLYAVMHYGGGCSGSDCNSSYIIDPKGVTVAKHETCI